MIVSSLADVPEELRSVLIRDRKVSLVLLPLASAVLAALVWDYYGPGWAISAWAVLVVVPLVSWPRAEHRRIRVYRELGLIRIDPLHLGVSVGKLLLLGLPIGIGLAGLLIGLRWAFDIDLGPLGGGILAGLAAGVMLQVMTHRKLSEIRAARRENPGNG